MRHDWPRDLPPQPVADPLSIAALDTERHVAAAGWDQNPRLFALVPTADLVEREPQLRGRAGPRRPRRRRAARRSSRRTCRATSSSSPCSAGIAWPETVAGAALAVERIVVPPEAERDLPENPSRRSTPSPPTPTGSDVRLLVAVTRDGQSRCLLRQRAHDSDDQVALGDDIAPGLVHALRATLQD